MKVDCISDLHGFFPALEGGDLLLVAGDLTYADTLFQHSEARNWLLKQPYEKKILIGGNHDNFLQANPDFYDQSDIDYLLDSEAEFCGLKIWGSPWTRSFKGQNPRCKAFCLDTETELREKWDLIPLDIDILLTHSPPYGKLDKTCRCQFVGSSTLLEKINKMDKSLKLNCFGHIHEAHGMIEGNPIFINASINDDCYIPINKPIRVIL